MNTRIVTTLAALALLHGRVLAQPADDGPKGPETVEVTPPPAAAPAPEAAAPAEVPKASGAARRPAQPRDPKVTLGLGATLVWTGDKGYGAMREPARRAQVDLMAGYEVWRASRFRLSVGASFRSDYADGETIEVTSNALQAEAAIRYELSPWLSPQLRLAGGVVLSRLEQTATASALSTDTHDRSGVLTAGAGLLACTAPGVLATRFGRLTSLSVGVLVEGGYVWAGPATFMADSSEAGDVTRRGVSLGSLALGGGYLRVMAVVRF